MAALSPTVTIEWSLTRMNYGMRDAWNNISCLTKSLRKQRERELLSMSVIAKMAGDLPIKENVFDLRPPADVVENHVSVRE